MGAIRSVTEKLGIGSAETVRRWARREQAADDPVAAKSSKESAELKQLRAEVRELRRANEIRDREGRKECRHSVAAERLRRRVAPPAQTTKPPNNRGF
jgi:transposase-like protein